MSAGVCTRTLILRDQAGGATSRTLTVPAHRTLLDVVRRDLGLPLARGCRDGSCGSCRVLVDGQVVNACVTTVESLPEEARVETYEDVADDPAARRAVGAFEGERPTRCRLCIPALAVTAVGLARARGDGSEKPSAEAVDECLEDATCQCTGRGSLRRSLLA